MTAEAGHAPNRIYTARDGSLHLNGAALYNDAETDISGLMDSVKVPAAGTPGTNVTATEYTADGINYTTVLTLSGVAATIGDNASLAGGALIYTLPAGACVINSCYMAVGLTLTTGTPTTDTPEIGLGTTQGTGAQATLGDVAATAENISGPAVANDVAGTVELLTAALGLAIEAAAAHTVYLNYADAWADVDNTAGTLDGTVTLNWSKLPVS